MEFDPLFIRNGLLVFILLVASIVLHEWGHAVAAHILGDDTPGAAGRRTLNPLPHLDLLGTVFVPIINIFMLGGGLAFIGWGKPVATNPANFRKPVRDDVIVCLAGPAVNLLVALAAILAGSCAAAGHPRFAELVKGLVIMNVGLAVFNLIPLPPLDGASILRRLFGVSDAAYFSMSRWISLVLILAINVDASRAVLAAVVARACVPFAALCARLNPSAFALIFRP